MSQVTDAVAELEGDELVEWLATYEYAAPETEPKAPYGTPQWGRQYNETGDAGTGGGAPNTWDEVEYLKEVGLLDREVYYAALKRRHESLGDSGGDTS